jgi:hypothetical protein
MAGFGVEDPISAYFVILLKDNDIKAILYAVLSCSYSTWASSDYADPWIHKLIITYNLM